MANIDSVKLPNGNEYNLQDVVTPRTAASQPNLLINPWFTVNQRGFTSSSGTAAIYTTDHWYILTDGGTGGSTSVNADGSMHLVAGSANNGIQNVVEVADYESEFQGKKVTLSVHLKNGTIYHATTDALPARTSSNVEVLHEEVTTGLTLILMVARLSAWYAFQARIVVTAGSTFDLRAVKLEIGSTSTLHLDTAPDYTTELLKCQRYFIRFTHAEQWKAFDMVQNISTSEAAWVLNLPVPMRATPTFKSAGTFQLYAATPVLVSTFTATFSNLETVVVSITGSASNLTPWATSRLNNSTANAYIELDAEL